MQVTESKKLKESDKKEHLCRVFILTGNCPNLNTCQCKHELASKEFEEKKQSDNVVTQSKPKPKPLLKKPTKQKEFMPTQEGSATMKEFLGSTQKEEEKHEDNGFFNGIVDDDDNEVFLDNGGDELEFISRDPTLFYEAFKGCHCCKGHVYNCEGQTCLILGSCFCYGMEQNDKIFNQGQQ